MVQARRSQPDPADSLHEREARLISGLVDASLHPDDLSEARRIAEQPAGQALLLELERLRADLRRLSGYGPAVTRCDAFADAVLDEWEAARSRQAALAPLPLTESRGRRWPGGLVAAAACVAGALVLWQMFSVEPDAAGRQDVRTLVMDETGLADPLPRGLGGTLPEAAFGPMALPAAVDAMAYRLEHLEVRADNAAAEADVLDGLHRLAIAEGLHLHRLHVLDVDVLVYSTELSGVSEALDRLVDSLLAAVQRPARLILLDLPTPVAGRVQEGLAARGDVRVRSRDAGHQGPAAARSAGDAMPSNPPAGMAGLPQSVGPVRTVLAVELRLAA